jgi:hypothetical protein
MASQPDVWVPEKLPREPGFLRDYLGRYNAAMMALFEDSDRGPFDWRVLAKWSNGLTHRSLKPKEHRHIVEMGAFFKSEGAFRPPTALYRVVRVDGTLPPLAFARGWASWSEHDPRKQNYRYLDGAEAGFAFVWNRPPSSSVVLDLDSVMAWLRKNRPEVNLNKGGHGGLPDKGEYIVRSGRLHIVGTPTQDGKAIRVELAGSMENSQ